MVKRMKIDKSKRLTNKEALDLIKNASLLELGVLASQKKDELHPDKRNSGKHICEKVLIGENVFIASNVKILKGVSIGKNSVIANGSLVISDVPENSVYGGIPAKFIKKLD